MKNIFKQNTKCKHFNNTTDLLNSDNLKVGITQLCNDVTGLKFQNVIADPNVAE